MEKQRNFEESSSQVAVVMVPLAAQGHLNQLLHLSRLIAAHNISVHYVGSATHIRQAKLRLHGWDHPSNNIHFQEFPIPPFTTPPPDPAASHKFPSQLVPALTATTHLRRPLHAFVDGLAGAFKRVIVIYDLLMSYVVQDIGSIPNADCYIFRSISCFCVCSWEAPPDLPTAAAGILTQVPSVKGYYSKEFQDFLDLQFSAKKVSSGEIYNSCREIEGFYLDLWEERINKDGVLNLWAMGPFNPAKIPIKTDHGCLKWLDKQPPNSVILISFGTTSAISDEQIGEIAAGLERSDQKFIWIVRDADKGDIFAGDPVRDTQQRLPEGFEERVRERGIVVREWAPQMEILGHPSTGGFMSHCGWNSCLESITSGVPVAAWPMHSDQPANAVLLARVLRIAVEVERWTRLGARAVVAAGRVEEVVTTLMATAEGDAMRKRAAELGERVRSSMAEGRRLESFIAHITRI
ncbi:zeatin O-glucosyltransferase-like [Salvia miltiorrhiza]|uniref:zeatin O-glucosyltransferase-like n=1 Tax=Salvia miltiorrhiza TaxID=226208 RepID=UPI0025ACD471|nr:zeatin O-glucosyltransferase-like [Salvia miltiorrhiza]